MGEALHDPAFFAWYGVLQVQARTMEIIARELEARTGLPASWYELLACLSGNPEPESGCRMNEIADELLISRGGATKLVARLEEAGYVQRVTPPDDRRATYAKLTPAGLAAVEAAHPVQLELTRDYFGRFVTPDELVELTRISANVLRGLGAECGWLAAASGTPESSVTLGSTTTASAATPATEQ